MTAKLFIVIDALVFLLLFLLGASIVKDDEHQDIVKIDTVTEIRSYQQREQEYKMFLKGVLGQDPKKSN